VDKREAKENTGSEISLKFWKFDPNTQQ